MSLPTKLPPESLYRACPPESLDFNTTADLPDTEEPVGQARAVESIRFAIGMRHRGYNLFALGSEGTGRRSLVMQYLRQEAAEKPVPDDWIYVHGFDEDHRPHAIRLPSGRGAQLKKDMEWLSEELLAALPAAFESDEYGEKRDELESVLQERQDEALEAARLEAEKKDIALLRSPVGLSITPMKDGKSLTAEEFEALPEDEQARRQGEMEDFQDVLAASVKQFPQWQRETRDLIRELDQEVVSFAISHLMEDLHERWADQPEVLEHLVAVANDIADNVDEFLEEEDEAGDDGEEEGGEDGDGEARDEEQTRRPLRGRRRTGSEGGIRRYRVNVLVSHAHATGAPVIYEDHPTQPNVVGRVEHIAQYGALVTDFNLIRAGSLHKANGGYLVLDAHKLLMNPYAWEDLKRALRAREIRIESPGQSTGLMSTVSLEPQPIPLDIKVVLIGDSTLYYMLSQNDPEFSELFKVAADFDWRMDRTDETMMGTARSIATLTRKEDLRPLERGAVARVIEEASRMVEDSSKLSTHMASLADLVREADYWAGRAGAQSVTAGHVQQAVDASTYRQDRVRENVQEEILRGVVRIDTDGAVIGQINGLSVLELGNFAFGRPSRITARVSIGKGEVVDIEREVDLGGPLHGKGVLILTALLAGRFGCNRQLSLEASLVFEQSYGGVDGDSASCAEFYTLLSALSQVPLRQDLAVTGSVDQHGFVQAIGGVNEKIEGFFDLCVARGLTGTQGVMIPATNADHLMLRHDVVEACRQGKFAVYAVETVDEGIELLTGLQAGVRDDNGDFPPGSINRKVESRLAAFARRADDSPSAFGLGRAGRADR